MPVHANTRSSAFLSRLFAIVAVILSAGLGGLTPSAEGFLGSATVTYRLSGYGAYGPSGPFANGSPTGSLAVKHLTASYDSSTGAVAVHLRFFTSFSAANGSQPGEQVDFGTDAPSPDVCSGASDDWSINYGSSGALLGPAETNSFPPPIPDLAVTQTTDSDGQGITLTVTSPALAHYAIICAGIIGDWVYYANPGPDAIFTIPLSVHDAQSAFKKLLGIRANSRASTRTSCRALSETRVTCSTSNRRGKVTASVTGTMSRNPGDLTIYGSFVVHKSMPLRTTRLPRARDRERVHESQTMTSAVPAAGPRRGL